MNQTAGMGFYGARWVLTLLILGMALFIGYRVFTHMRAQESLSSSLPIDTNPADAWIKGFTYRQTQSGVAKWEVVAERAKVFEDQHRAQLENVTVHLFGKEGKEMTVEAEQGTIDTETNNFDLQNQEDSIVVRLENGYTILSKHLQWVEASNQIKTQTSVTIKGQGVVITGRGLVGNLDDEEFRLLHNVRAQVSL